MTRIGSPFRAGAGEGQWPLLRAIKLLTVLDPADDLAEELVTLVRAVAWARYRNPRKPPLRSELKAAIEHLDRPLVTNGARMRAGLRPPAAAAHEGGEP